MEILTFNQQANSLLKIQLVHYSQKKLSCLCGEYETATLIIQNDELRGVWLTKLRGTNQLSPTK